MRYLTGAIIILGSWPGLLLGDTTVPRSLADAVVRVDADHAYGTGVFISESPPVILTCFHVVKNRTVISVHTAYGDVRIKKLWVNRDADLAYLSPNPIDLLTAPAALTLAKAQEADYSFIGYSSYNLAPSETKRVLKATEALNGFNGQPPPLNLRVDLQVIEFGGDIYPGDSGAPLFTLEGKLVAITAGMVLMPNKKPRYFALKVPEKAPEFSTLAWSTDTSGDDPYAKSVNPYLSTMVYERDVPWPNDMAVNKEARPCIPTLERLISLYRGRRKDLPEKLDGTTDTCQRYYAALRKPIVKEEKDRLAQRWLSAQSVTNLLTDFVTNNKSRIITIQTAVDRGILPETTFQNNMLNLEDVVSFEDPKTKIEQILMHAPP